MAARAVRGPDPVQVDLLDRVRAALAGRELREVAMFGGRAVMVDGAMLVSVGRGGDLLVRIDPARHDELVARPGAGPAVMGTDRPMGPGWITVSADALDEEADLAFWLGVAAEHHARLGRG
ncbi:TfoX/Sxy family protein [Kineococcus gynurae]|uniref:TfoX/Sxy family protein n=1 Tax=Kineococcus gynurae TaxID=452979 RepID=A0ABV5LVT9_9ACTN